MWIRSQDKLKLQQPNRIQILIIQFSNEYKIVDYELFTDQAEDYDILGVYKTKERAIEILDDIQRNIECKEPELIMYPKSVYQMPEE